MEKRHGAWDEEYIGALVSEARQVYRARREVKRKFSEPELLILSGDDRRTVRTLYNDQLPFSILILHPVYPAARS